MPVPASRVEGFSHTEKPGDFYITPPNEHEGLARRLSFLCPCGCRDLCGIRIRDDGLQENGAWAWDRNQDKPTTFPSIAINHGHWHGYLIEGVFWDCEELTPEQIEHAKQLATSQPSV